MPASPGAPTVSDDDPLRLAGVEVPLRIRSRRPLRMMVKPAADPVVSGWIERHGCWEPYNTVLLQDLLTEGDVFLDVGANLGYFTLVAADRVGPTGRVHAFEPEPENHRFCAENVARNGLSGVATAHRLGLADRPGEQLLFRSSSNHGGHQLVHALPEHGGSEGIAVPLTTLDHFVAEHPEIDRIDVVKMDVQGYETRALLGMREQIARHRERLILLVEFSPTLLQSFDEDGTAGGTGLQRFLRFLADESAVVFGVERLSPAPGAVGLVPLSLDELCEQVPGLCADSLEMGMDSCIDLVVLFSPEAVAGFERRIAAAGAAGG
ncbi:MAG TPA: FkbM family methyltransferase [Thermoanaerobaculia bacterium]|jgi:FkbM family methyltransferase|nr:FkbM family methyltransferase [Thermoanaerobaculia bacterium]